MLAVEKKVVIANAIDMVGISSTYRRSLAIHAPNYKVLKIESYKRKK